MGNSNEFQNLNAYIHPCLGPIKRLQNQNQQQYIEYQVRVESEKVVNEWQQKLKKIQNNKCKEFLLLPLNYSFRREVICGSQGTITLKFQDYMFRLADQIKNRKQIQRFFPQTQIWNMVFIFTTLGTLMENNHDKIGDIRPQNILINEEGQIKILSKHSWPGKRDNFQLLMENTQQITYLSPQQCIQYSKKNVSYPYCLDLSTCQVFSMGVTLLEMSSLEKSQQFYFNNNSQISQAKIRQTMDRIHLNYSQQLLTIIGEMVRISPQQRIKCSTIQALLLPYQTKIKELVPFIFDKPAFYSFLSNEKLKKNETIVSSSLNELPNIQKAGQTQNPNFKRYTSQIYPPFYGHHHLPNLPYINNLNTFNRYFFTPKIYPFYIVNKNLYYSVYKYNSLLTKKHQSTSITKISKVIKKQNGRISNSLILGNKESK